MGYAVAESADGSFAAVVLLKKSFPGFICRTFLLGLGFVFFSPDLGAATPRTVIDETRIFDRATAESLAEGIAEFERETGCHLIVKAVTYLDPGSSLRKEALKARREILPTGPVAILLLDRASKGLTLSLSPEHWQRYPMLKQVEAVRAASSAGAEAETLGSRLHLCAENWMSEVRVLEKERQRQLEPLSKRATILFSAYLGVLVVGAVFVWIVARVRRNAERSSAEQVSLPDVTVAPRLGAAFGGGVIAQWPRANTANTGQSN